MSEEVTASASVETPATLPPGIETAVAATETDAKGLAKTFLDGARSLLVTAATAGEADAEALVPVYENSAVTLASSFVPSEFRGIISTVAQLAGNPLTKLNESLDAEAKAILAIAVARIDSTVGALGG